MYAHISTAYYSLGHSKFYMVVTCLLCRNNTPKKASSHYWHELLDTSASGAFGRQHSSLCKNFSAPLPTNGSAKNYFEHKYNYTFLELTQNTQHISKGLHKIIIMNLPTHLAMSHKTRRVKRGKTRLPVQQYRAWGWRDRHHCWEETKDCWYNFLHKQVI
jgi:hypothetical protein